MRGPVQGVPPLLQPVAHALLQATEEVERLMSGFPDTLLWQRPAGVASVGFHLRHLTGVLDRLVTYARAEPLTPAQLEYLANEGKESAISANDVVSAFKNKVEETLHFLMSVDQNQLTEFRGVGRRQMPSTVLGLLFHAAEHTMRHVGQLLVTVRVLTAAAPYNG